jgi:hypothetical protein
VSQLEFVQPVIFPRGGRLVATAVYLSIAVLVAARATCSTRQSTLADSCVQFLPLGALELQDEI